MDTKAFILLLLVVMILCLGAGGYFYFSSTLNNHPVKSTPSLATMPPNPNIHQNNVAIIITSDLTEKSHKLIAVWMLFYIKTPSDIFTFKILYPPLSDDPDARLLAQTFGLTDNKAPSDKFIDSLNKYNLNQNKYLVLDPESLSAIYLWSTGKQIDPLKISPGILQPPEDTARQQQTLFQDFCDAVLNTKPPLGSDPDWGKLLKSHIFYSNFSLADVQNGFDPLYKNGKIPRCEVSGKQKANPYVTSSPVR